MAAGAMSVPMDKKPTLQTPKAIIHQRFGSKAFFTVEEVHDSSQNGCPGLAIPSKAPCLYRCRLQLPDLAIISDTFKKKKEAEQSAAELALEKLGIHPQTDNLSKEEAWNDIVVRINYLFSEKFLSDLHPLSGHFRAALQRDGGLYGSVPISTIVMLDSKLNNRAKIVNPEAESNPLMVMCYMMKAAKELPDYVVASDQTFSIHRKSAYPSEIINASQNQFTDSSESVPIEAVRIPCNLEEALEPITLNISLSGYYLDIIAQKLDLIDGNQVMISRTIGKASSETRLYFASPELKTSDLFLESLETFQPPCFQGSLNRRASYIYGQDIYGDAILASVGYMWKSQDLFYDNVTLQSYYRIRLSKMPSGIYKLSRHAILTAELPLSLTMKTNWRGSFPREMLSMFCRQHHLAEPEFRTPTAPLKSLSDMLRSHKKMKISESSEAETAYANGDGTTTSNKDVTDPGSTFWGEIKIFSKSGSLVLECSPRKSFKRQSDSIQNACLSVLLWLNEYFRNPNMPLEKLTSSADALAIQFNPQNFLKEFSSCASMQSCQNEIRQKTPLDLGYQISGADSGICPSSGAMACVSYSVSLVIDGENCKEVIESNEEFEFEIGTGSVFQSFESVLTQMSVGQCAHFSTGLPSKELVLAAASDSTRTLSLLSSGACYLEYSVLLLGVKAPAEERMEQALFSPPLSKQRVEYALKHIRESSATNLVDFGCGSGSLLDSLLDYPSSLEIITGIDISQKALARAAKMLHSKLSTGACCSVKSAVLYDGSVTNFDSRLHDFDIGTCLEVVEHMEEDQACAFGDIVLSSFRPKLLIVSTPNYEYNVILQRSSSESQDDDQEEKSLSQCKFRNHDHKFEWTRQQFNHWASELATRHNYGVEFSGVGGSGDVEPGFASQIAVFRRGAAREGDNASTALGAVTPYRVVWEWKGLQESETLISCEMES